MFQFDEKSCNIKETVQIILYTQNATAQSARLSKNKTKGTFSLEVINLFSSSAQLSMKGLGHLTPDFGLRFCLKLKFGI